MRTLAFINPPEYALNGDLRMEVTAGSELDGISRRVSRTKTLDQSVTITDMGYCEADRDITLTSSSMTETDYRLLREWFANYETVLLSLPSGVYSAAPYALTVNNGTVSATFMLSARLDI